MGHALCMLYVLVYQSIDGALSKHFQSWLNPVHSLLVLWANGLSADALTAALFLGFISVITFIATTLISPLRTIFFNAMGCTSATFCPSAKTTRCHYAERGFSYPRCCCVNIFISLQVTVNRSSDLCRQAMTLTVSLSLANFYYYLLNVEREAAISLISFSCPIAKSGEGINDFFQCPTNTMERGDCWEKRLVNVLYLL